MRRLVLIVPELLSESDPILDRALPGFTALAERSTLFRLSKPEPSETPEARFLGLKPSQAELRQGPLTVAAFGADPPVRSTHFHVSLLSLEGDVVQEPDPRPTAEELRAVTEAAVKLNTRALTFVAGIGLDHGLVWEGLGDMATVAAIELLGNGLRDRQPRGDGEPMLRQYIDDSVNLLNDLALNHRRVDEGFAPLNLLWPWGQGVRIPVPNLSLLRGEPAAVTSASLRLAGVTRLVGYRHSDISWLRTGLQTRLRDAAGRMLSGGSSILVLDAIAGFRLRTELDEAAFFARQLDSEVVQPILEQAAEEPLNLLLAAPSASHDGLALMFESKASLESTYPFDERSIDETKLARLDLESLVSNAMAPGTPIDP